MKGSTEGRAIIKELAMAAKNRLKQGRYGTKEENIILKKEIQRQNNLKLLANSECKKPEITIKIINDYEEYENFQQRVYSLLSGNEDVTNPIKQLSDQDSFQQMTESEQEKYILELSEKYTKARENYLQNYSGY